MNSSSAGPARIRLPRATRAARASRRAEIPTRASVPPSRFGSLDGRGEGVRASGGLRVDRREDAAPDFRLEAPPPRRLGRSEADQPEQDERPSGHPSGRRRGRGGLRHLRVGVGGERVPRRRSRRSLRSPRHPRDLGLRLHRRAQRSRPRGFLMLAPAARRFHGRRRLGSLQAARPLRIPRHHPHRPHQHRPDGLLEIPLPTRHPLAATRTHDPRARRRAPRHPRPRQARPPGRRRVDRQSHVSPGMSTRGPSLSLHHRRRVSARHVRRLCVPHRRRRVVRESPRESSRRVATREIGGVDKRRSERREPPRRRRERRQTPRAR